MSTRELNKNRNTKRVPNGTGNCQYLIIGGAPKSATTSLFRYLADHPQVCPSNRKETYFFAREFDYSRVCNLGTSLEDFKSYFTHCAESEMVYIEATPYTLYSTGAAERIATLLPDATMLFVLRDPIRRLWSDYRFHVQRNHPSARDTFHEFIVEQEKMNTGVPNLLQLGCYIRYLRPFFDAFESHRILVLFFEEFTADRLETMKEICRTIGVDANFYSDYDFGYHNPTIEVRYDWLNQVNMYLEVVAAEIRARIMDAPAVYRGFEKIVSGGKAIYNRLNDRERNRGHKKEDFIPSDVQRTLEDYYRSCNLELAEKLGRSLPW